MAGYELITTAPRPRTAVFRGRGNRQAGTTDGGSRRDPPQLRRRRNRWRVRQRICLGTCPTGKGAELVHVPAAVHVVRIGLPARAGTRPDSIDQATARCDADSGVLPGTRELSTGSCGH